MELHESVWKVVPYLFKDLLKPERPCVELHSKPRASSVLYRLFGNSNNSKTTTITTIIKEQEAIESHAAFRLRLDETKRIGIVTIQKFKSSQMYTMEQQLAMHRMLTRLPDFRRTMRVKRSLEAMLTRKQQRRARYIFMLLGTPVQNNVHPITAATRNKRRPYAETMQVIYAEEKTDFLPVEYLLDPSSLHTVVYKAKHKVGVSTVNVLVAQIAQLNIHR